MLNANSISAVINTPSLNLLTANLPETVTLSAQGFVAGIQQLLDYDAGKRLFWDDTVQQWMIVDPLSALTVVSRIESSQLQSLTYDVSTEGRFTAIKLFSNQLPVETGVQTITTNKGTFNLTRETVSLERHWSRDAQALWNIGRVEDTLPGSDDQSALWWVWRRFRMPDGTTPPFPGTPITFYYARELVPGEPGTERYQRFTARAYFDDYTVVARYPVILWDKSDIYAGGEQVFGPDNVAMTYYPVTGITGTLITSTTTAGTQTSVTTTINPADLLTQIRYPTTGYTGTAFSLFGVERELYALASPTEITTENAMSRLAPLKDVVISGSLPFYGDPIKSYMNLGVKVRVQHNVNATGIESFDAFCTSFRYAFGRPGMNNVELTTDRGVIV
jgi:hypothetical protein